MNQQFSGNMIGFSAQKNDKRYIQIYKKKRKRQEVDEYGS